MANRTDFYYSDKSEPHGFRTKAIIKDHPEVTKLIGRNPKTILIIIASVLLQIIAAYFVKDQAWWVVLLVAYFFGAFVDHTLFVMIHEASHRLIFRGKTSNLWAGILANLPTIFPSSVSFQRYHLKHHAFQGIHELDADLPGKWEAKLINNNWFGKALWLLFFPIMQIARTFRLKEIKPIDKWVITNWLSQIVFTTLIIMFLGPKALVYLIISFFFSVGLHPLGARWIQEHYLTLNEEQETYSYYGILNKINCNVGYHNEHHDFPSIPWNKLPKLKSIADEYYEPLYYHKSWTKLFLQFIFDKNISLYSRILRHDRGIPMVEEKEKMLNVPKE